MGLLHADFLARLIISLMVPKSGDDRRVCSGPEDSGWLFGQYVKRSFNFLATFCSILNRSCVAVRVFLAQARHEKTWHVGAPLAASKAARRKLAFLEALRWHVRALFERHQVKVFSPTLSPTCQGSNRLGGFQPMV